MSGLDKTSKASISRTGFTLLLMIIWLALISFSIISATDPPWLRKIAHIGRSDEAAGMKDYGDNFLRQKDYPMAIAQYQSALQIKPDYLEAMINMATSYYLMGNTRQGIKIFQDALRLKSGYEGTVYFNMADLYEKQGKNDQAIDCLLKALDAGAEQDPIYCRLGVLYLKVGRSDDALSSFENALRIQVDQTTPYMKMLITNLAAFTYDEENLPVIKEMIKKGVTIEDLKAYDPETIKNVTESDPEIAKTHNFLGMIYLNRGKIEKAAEQFELSEQIWPGNPVAQKNMLALRQLKNTRADAR
jgi:tetratricopeptide (TPR) repeat protein